MYAQIEWLAGPLADMMEPSSTRYHMHPLSLIVSTWRWKSKVKDLGISDTPLERAENEVLEYVSTVSPVGRGPGLRTIPPGFNPAQELYY